MREKNIPIKILLVLIICNLHIINTNSKKIKVAIIGSGISGLSTAYHLYKRHFLTHLKDGYTNYELETIDIYEKDSEIGGRMYTFKDDNGIKNPSKEERLYVDMGASFIIKENLLAMELIKLTESELIDQPENEKLITIMNKELETLITLDGGFYFNFIKLIYKYKLAIINSDTLVNEFYEDFKEIYNWLEQGNAYEGIEEFCLKNNFQNLVSESTFNYFNSKLNSNFISEVLSSFIRSCYNQTTNINAFAGKIILTAFIKKAYSLKYGFNSFLNRILLKLQNYPESIFKNDIQNIISSATSENKRLRMKDSIEYYRQPAIKIFTSKKINSITRVISNSNNKFLYPRYLLNDDKEEYYDYVIFSANISESKITFINFNGINSTNFVNSEFDNLNKFVNTSEVLVKGEIDNSKFNLDLGYKFTVILFNEPLDKNEFNNISDIIRIKEGIYKIQISDTKVNKETILKLFKNGASILKVKTWKKPYPELNSVNKENISKLTSFRIFGIDNGIFFTNAIENLASCVELSIISAKNTANLVHNVEENGGIRLQSAEKNETIKENEKKKDL